MLRAPSNRRKSRGNQRLNLIPILDSVFIFIFFLLMSANFIKIFEIQSNVPIVSEAEPKPDEKPLALMLRIDSSKLILYSGIPSTYLREFGKDSNGEYDLESLHNYLISLKKIKKNREEKSIIFEPVFNIEYEKIVQIMDAVMYFRNTDPTLTRKDKEGSDVKIKELFSEIIFGNIQS